MNFTFSPKLWHSICFRIKERSGDNLVEHNHCVEIVRIRSYSILYFPAYGKKNYCSVRMLENTDQNNSKYRHFLRSE